MQNDGIYYIFLNGKHIFSQAKHVMLKKNASVTSGHAEVLGGSLLLWIS